MPITNRNLEPGTRLVATYKKARHTCEVAATDDGKLVFRYDGKDYKSPSSAGSAVMGGTACNGWRFWTIEGEEHEPKAGKAPETNGAKKTIRVIKKVPNQKGVAEGQARYFCSDCMKGFTGPSAPFPATCPDGHAREADERTSEAAD